MRVRPWKKPLKTVSSEWIFWIIWDNKSLTISGTKPAAWPLKKDIVRNSFSATDQSFLRTLASCEQWGHVRFVRDILSSVGMNNTQRVTALQLELSIRSRDGARSSLFIMCVLRNDSDCTRTVAVPHFRPLVAGFLPQSPRIKPR